MNEKTPYYVPKSLLTTRNVKTEKGEKLGWKTYILYMSPYNQNSQGKNICPMATPGCSSACLYGSGRGSLPVVRTGRTNKTEMFLHNRKLFVETLHSELTKLSEKHGKEGVKFTIRLNGTSDISWESINVKDGKNLFELFPKVQFYDYTKNHTRFDRKLPENYYLMFSRSETNDAKAMELLKRNINVAIVFDKVPKSYMGYEVVEGDENDLRFLDKKGVIVGLKYKKLTGKGVDNEKIFKSGFAIRTEKVVSFEPGLAA